MKAQEKRSNVWSHLDSDKDSKFGVDNQRLISLSWPIASHSLFGINHSYLINSRN